MTELLKMKIKRHDLIYFNILVKAKIDSKLDKGTCELFQMNFLNFQE